MRIAARCCLTLGTDRLACSSFIYAAIRMGWSRSRFRFRIAHQASKRRIAQKYALRVLSLGISAVKNSQNRRADWGEAAKSAGVANSLPRRDDQRRRHAGCQCAFRVRIGFEIGTLAAPRGLHRTESPKFRVLGPVWNHNTG